MRKEAIFSIFVCVAMLSTIFPMGLDNEAEAYSNNLQPPSEEWNHTYGGDNYDLLYYVLQTNDGKYVSVGAITKYDSYGNEVQYAWIIKVDENGNLEWENTALPNYVAVSPTSVKQISDGGYIVCGYYTANDGSWRGFLWKLNSEGETEWTKLYDERIWDLIEVNDGYICTGYIVLSNDDYDAVLLKADKSGTIQWKKTYRYGNGIDTARSIYETDDGYVIGGYAGTDKGLDFWLIKTDKNGNKQWDKTYGGEKDELFSTRTCFQTSDGGFLMAGWTSSYGAGNDDIWLVKTDGNGNMIWNETYGGKGRDRIWGASPADNGYILACTKNYGKTGGSRGDVWVIRTDGDGNVVWSQIFGGRKEDRGYHICSTNDGGYIVAGRTESFGAGNSDGWLIKIAPDKELLRPSIQLTKPKNGYIYLFDVIGIPFPFFSQAIVLGDITFQVEASCGSEGYVISKVEYFIDGKLVGEATESPFSYKWTGAEPGTYYLKARAYNSWGGTSQVTALIKKVM